MAKAKKKRTIGANEEKNDRLTEKQAEIHTIVKKN